MESPASSALPDTVSWCHSGRDRACPTRPEYTGRIDPSGEGHGMLTCYGDEVRLPQSILAYVGFRLAALDTLCQMDACHGTGDDEIAGFLAEVPLLAQAAPAVQIDLLAGAWRRHQAPEPHEASLLDAAVIYTAFCIAGRVVNDQFDIARSWLKAGPRRVRCRLGGHTAERLYDLFFEFWDDEDFLSLSELQDLTPEHARHVRELLRLPDEVIRELEDVLTRARASPAVLTNLKGLLTQEEIEGFARVLLPGKTLL
jgi:hypothetical protein